VPNDHDNPHPSPPQGPDETEPSVDVPPVTDEAILRWARRFIEELAKGEHADLHSLEGEPFERHVALAQVVPEKLRDRRDTVRRAAAWVAGAADVHDEQTIPLLSRFLRDRSPHTRMAAAWACREIGADAAAAVPTLIAALEDPNDGVRYAAVCALRGIGPAAATAIPALIDTANTAPPGELRADTVKAVADIAPDDPAVQELVIQALKDPDRAQRFAGAYGIAQAADVPAEALMVLAGNLESADPSLVTVTAWAIGKLAAVEGQSPAPALLEALKRMHWLRIAYNEVPGDEFVSIRPVIGDALKPHLPVSDDPDPEFEDFRLMFFLHVFRPSPPANNNWIDEIVHHRWYLKVQRRRFGRAASTAERTAIREMVREAQAKLAVRMLKNPTLGVTPADYGRLTGFIWYHARNIAWRLRKRRAAQTRRELPGDDIGLDLQQQAAPDSGDDIERELTELIDAHLPADEQDVARLRWVERWTISETAAALGLTPSQVRTREKNARQRLAAQLG
jgi:RNA polymerase sigma factor (sigma-70 family)